MGLQEAWKGWVECVILVGLVGAEGVGLRWEGGVLDGNVDDCLGKWEESFGDGGRRVEEGDKKDVSQC